MQSRETIEAQNNYEREVAAEIGIGFSVCIGMDGASEVNAIISDLISHCNNPNYGLSPGVALGVRIWLEIVRADGVRARARGVPGEGYRETPEGFDVRMTEELAKPQSARAREEIGRLYTSKARKL